MLDRGRLEDGLRDGGEAYMVAVGKDFSMDSDRENQDSFRLEKTGIPLLMVSAHVPENAK